MSLNFVETINDYFSPGVIDQLAKSLNESPEFIAKAVSALIPVGLGSVLNIATSGKEGSNHIYDLAGNAASFEPPSVDIKSLHNENQNRHFIEDVFESNEYEVIELITKYAGIQNTTTSHLMSLIVPPLLGSLGKHAMENDLSASGLSGFLSSQYTHILHAIPEELSSLNNMADIHSVSVVKTKAKSAHRTTVTKTINEMKAAPGIYEEDKPGGLKWLLPLILIIVAIVLIWYFTKG